MLVASHQLIDRCRPALRCALAAATLLAASAITAWGRAPEPTLRIDLRALGYQDFSSQMLESGAALLTTHFVDSNHLLVTFGRRRLLTRIPDDPPDDMDRNLDALLLELPSGKLLARTSWRAHDLGQYLWPLGEGNFLLRDRDRLVTLSPMRNLARGDAFVEQPLLTSRRPIGALFVSADGKLLTVETLDRKAVAKERTPSPRTRAYAAAQAEEEAERTPDPVQVNFFRLGSQPETRLPMLQRAGEVRSPALILVPADEAGYIATINQGQHHYAFDFHEHTGKVNELSPFDSSCQPAPILVNRSEFIALGCRGGTQLQMVGGFNLHGEEMWEQVMPEAYVNPNFSFAPQAGRFAFGRVITTSAIEDGRSDAISRSLGIHPQSGGPVSAQILSQTVNVFQMETGRNLFTVTCTPVIRAGGNFALAADGSELAVARSGVIEIYKLPPMTGKEQTLLARAVTYAPQANDAPVRLNGRAETLPSPAQEKERVESLADGAGEMTSAENSEAKQTLAAPAQSPTTQDPTAMTSAASQAPSSVGEAVVLQPKGRQQAAALKPANDGERATPSGDETTHRKPPTLYKPGEKQPGTATNTATPNPE